MSSHRLNRIAEDVKRSLSEILRDLKDPRISSLISVIRVDITNDLSFAKVYISAIEGHEKTLESVDGLKNATGFIKRELSAKVKLRKMPHLIFIADDSIAYGAKISEIIEKFPNQHEGEEE